MVFCITGGKELMVDKKKHDDEIENLFKKFDENLKEVEEKFSDIEQNIELLRKENKPEDV